MIKALYTSATGMRVNQFLLDVTANNLANVNTTGFKRVQANFQDLLYDKFIPAGVESAQGIQVPTGLEVGSGARVVSTNKTFTQGVPTNTNRDLDLSIQGDGFFQISHPDGATVYTRDGTFQLNSDGEMVTAEGLKLEPSISITGDVVAISIGTDGTVSTQSSDGTSQSLGQITIANFPNPPGLESVGRNLLRETTASGTPLTGTPGEEGFGNLIQGFLESSNVQIATEMVNIIVSQRAFEASSKAISASDDMLAVTNRLVS